MFLTLLLIWLLVGTFIRITPAIKWHSIIVGGVASAYILILYAGRIPKQRKFRILGPLNVDKKGIHFNVLVNNSEEKHVSILYTDIERARHYRESYVINVPGTKYRFQRICFDDSDSFRKFREKIQENYERKEIKS